MSARELFSKIKAQRAIEVQGRGPFAYDVESDFMSGGKKHVLGVRQRGFNGMRRITDGQIESLQYGTNVASLASVFRQGGAVVLPNALGEVLTPSAVSIDDPGRVLVGAARPDARGQRRHCRRPSVSSATWAPIDRSSSDNAAFVPKS